MRAVKLTTILTIPIYCKTIGICSQIRQCSKRQVGEPGKPNRPSDDSWIQWRNRQVETYVKMKIESDAEAIGKRA